MTITLQRLNDFHYAHYAPEVLSSARARVLWPEEKEGGQALLQGVEHMHARELTL